MNYDITFCEGTNCQRKEQCHRYRELLRYRAWLFKSMDFVDYEPRRGFRCAEYFTKR